ncbi:MAG: T9SS type A sorting domain-containing protein [Prolixibacteraceae bacterium]|nr:T9SS type A sorting domain-containing protein [Prolixibacteraceae bacterium]
MNFPKFTLILGFWAITATIAFSQIPVQIDIDVSKGKKPVSPYIYGKNNVLPSTFLNSGTTAGITKAKEAGVRFVRQGGGNNSTKYNWRLKLSSHPDWYNNVYANDWDGAARNLIDKMPGVQGMWSFQLLGKAAANAKNNFGDWAYNQSKWWEGVNQNLAGGGTPNPTGSKAKVEGNPDLYLMEWTADSTVGILDKWFEDKGLGYNKDQFRYWSMDNEPEIWSGTHDDVMKTQCTAEEFMQLYFKVAKAARAKYPDIKLLGPVPANEWQWYNWSGGSKINGVHYPWLEFFIKRIAEEEKASGIKLLDVLDIHFYPGESDATNCVQLHRVYFDRNYVYPGANGVKNITGVWNASLTKEYILGRCSDWLTKYKGANHGVGLAVTETDIASSNANVLAVWYASTMGEFMKNGVEVFTPWSWKEGMWETLHLFSRYNQENYVQAISQNETLVSAYPTINEAADSMTVVLVNRSLTETIQVNLNFSEFRVNPGKSPMHSISNLGAAETFISRSNNALKKTQVEASASNISVELAPLSVNSISLVALAMGSDYEMQKNSFKASVYPNPATDQANLNFSLPEKEKISIELYQANGVLLNTISNKIFDAGNHQLDLNTVGLASGIYWIRFTSETDTKTVKLIKN